VTNPRGQPAPPGAAPCPGAACSSRESVPHRAGKQRGRRRRLDRRPLPTCRAAWKKL